MKNENSQIKSLLKQIAYVCVYSSNLEDSVQFYREILGLEPTGSKNDDADFFSFKTGTTSLAIERNRVRKKGMKTKAENSILLQFKAESKEHLEEINRHLEKNKVKLLARSKVRSYGLITNFCDPDGNKLEILYQE